nr:glucokinase [Dissulfurirhabdus thermomarina]
MAGDIGGTNARLAVVSEGRILFERWYPARDFPDFETVMGRFASEWGRPLPDLGCLAVAGAVQDNRVRATNLPWTIDGDELASRFGLSALRLANDFEAAAAGVLALAPEDLVQLGGGPPEPDRPKAVLGPGTGLGQAILVPCRGRYEVVPTEGGHADFAPPDAEAAGLLAALADRYGHVSVERVLSGPGLVETYRYFFRAAEEAGVPPLRDPAEISRAGMEGSDPTARRALDLFRRVLAAEAGNLALRCLAGGGVYLAGGIAPKILPVLREPAFRRAFEAKGRMAGLLARIPVFVVVHPAVGLVGAARLAAAGPEQAPARAETA